MLRKTYNPTRVTLGDNGKFGKKSIIDAMLNKFDLRVPKTASTTAVLPATAASNTGATTATFYYELEQPRSITITSTGTAGSVTATAIVVTGVNVEGKVITESLTPTAGTLGTVSGTKAFAAVTGISIPQQTGTGVSYSIGTGLNFGIGSRNLSVTQVKLYKQVLSSGTQSLVNPGSTNFDSALVENNWITLDVTPSGLSRYRVYSFNYNWHLNPVNDLTKGLQSYGI